MPPRPTGRPTRGKTATNRLRQVDVYVALAHPGVLRGDSPLAVDLGYGALPWTTLEMASRWRDIEPSLRVIGIEIDPERVSAAQPCADPPMTRFERGGFNLVDVLGAERARVVRAYNVLRQYGEADVESALAQIADGMDPGGLLVEGTSTPSGAIVVFDTWVRTQQPASPMRSRPAVVNRLPEPSTDELGLLLEHDALVFGTNFKELVAPSEFQTILPKRLIHRMLDETPARFFADWRRASNIATGQGATSARRNWVVAAELMRSQFGWPVDPRSRLVERGFLAVHTDLRDRS